jgi:hypothetical protein
MPIPAFPLPGRTSTVDGVTGLLLLLTVVAVLGVGYMALTRLRLLLHTVHDVGKHVQAARAAHDHHVDSLHNRMRAVEASAATAERESRIGTLHMADLNRVMLQQAEILASIRDSLGAQPDTANTHRLLRSPVPRVTDRGGQR